MIMNIARRFVSVLVSAVVALGALCETADSLYTNPIIHADYSDPDVIRTSEGYWMVASSFTSFPGIPVLFSPDLIHWRIAGHVYGSLPTGGYERPAHGRGSWAPAIREHDGRFYVYFCTPDEGLFVAVAPHPTGPYELTQVADAAKWEDPCPFWDDDGNAYLIRSVHRGGPAIIHRMSPDGMRLLDDGVTVYHDPEVNPVLEGMKMMKRDGWYYILAPAGGVSHGWQTVLRSRNIYGPYEQRRVLEEGGDSGINGPHQGALVDTPDGREWWFVHFQSKGIHGRIVNLQPARFTPDGWIEMGAGGHPVASHRRPAIAVSGPLPEMQTTDLFTDSVLGLQWQWQANPRPRWHSLTERPGWLCLNAENCPTEGGNLYYAPNLLLQKLPAEHFRATAVVEPEFADSLARAGLVMFGQEYSYIALSADSIMVCRGKGDKRFPAGVSVDASVPRLSEKLWLRVELDGGEECRYSYSTDGEEFRPLGQPQKVAPGVWTGAKVGLFCITPSVVPSDSRAWFDSFVIEPIR